MKTLFLVFLLKPHFLLVCAQRIDSSFWKCVRADLPSIVYSTHCAAHISNRSLLTDVIVSSQIDPFLQQCLVSSPPGLTASQRSPRPPMRSPLKHPEPPTSRQYISQQALPSHPHSTFCLDLLHKCCFHRSLLLSDDEEDTKRVVRSAKDKRLVWRLFKR